MSNTLQRDLLCVQFQWNKVAEELVENDLFVNTDWFDMCIGFCLGFGCSAEDAVSIANHEMTNV